MRDSLVKKYSEITDKLQYISCKIDQLTTAKKEELKAAGKEVPPTPVILDSDNEEESEEDKEEDETKYVDLTEGGDELHDQAVAIPKSTSQEAQDENKEELKKTEADQIAAIQETGQTAQPVTNEGIFSCCESF